MNCEFCQKEIKGQVIHDEDLDIYLDSECNLKDEEINELWEGE